MTGLEHFLEAERLVRQNTPAAQVHATLAQVAVFAMAMAADREDLITEAEVEAWARAVTSHPSEGEGEGPSA